MINEIEQIVQMINAVMNARYVERCISKAIIKRNITLNPSSAGTTEAASDAKDVPLFNAIKINATIIVDGSVPSIPPAFEPYFSAINMTRMTTSAESIKGMTIWISGESIGYGDILVIEK